MSVAQTTSSSHSTCCDAAGRVVAQPDQGQGRQADIERAAGGAVERRASARRADARAPAARPATSMAQGRRAGIPAPAPARPTASGRCRSAVTSGRAAGARRRPAGPLAGHDHDRHQDQRRRTASRRRGRRQHAPQRQHEARDDPLAQRRVEALSRPKRHSAARAGGYSRSASRRCSSAKSGQLNGMKTSSV